MIEKRLFAHPSKLTALLAVVASGAALALGACSSSTDSTSTPAPTASHEGGGSTSAPPPTDQTDEPLPDHPHLDAAPEIDASHDPEDAGSD